MYLYKPDLHNDYYRIKKYKDVINEDYDKKIYKDT